MFEQLKRLKTAFEDVRECLDADGNIEKGSPTFMESIMYLNAQGYARYEDDKWIVDWSILQDLREQEQ